MLNPIITILLIIILSPVILVAGVIALGLILCLIVYTAITILMLVIMITEQISKIVHNILKLIKKEGKNNETKLD